MQKLQILFAALFLLFLSNSIFAQRKPVDLIISGGTIVTMSAEKRLIENGAVAVEKSQIVAVGTASEIAQKFTARQTINASNKVVIPGLINTHPTF